MSDSIKLSTKHGVNPTIPVCFWCGNDKNEIALMGEIDKEDSEAPRRLITNYEPCDKCKELFSKGIHVIGVKEVPISEKQFPIVSDGNNTLYPTGSMFLAPEGYIREILKDDENMLERTLEQKALLMPDEVVVAIVNHIKEEDRMEVNVPEDLAEEVTEDENN